MSEVAVIKCAEYDEKKIKESIIKALELIGGLGRFINKGERILLKPNFLAGDSPEKCSTTHPLFIKAVAEILLDFGALVSYGDSPGFGSPIQTAKKNGFYEYARLLNIKAADFENGEEVFFENGRQNKKFFIAKGVLEADGVISLPKLKTHGLEKFTGSVKNQLGCIPGLRKGEFHVRIPDAYDFAKMLVDLNNFIKPRLYIMDGIRAMEGNGPRGGNPRAMDCILLSSDPIALDATACRLINLDPELVPTNIFGYEYGAGTYKKNDIKLFGDDFNSLYKADFDVDRTKIKSFNKTGVFHFLSNALVAKPFINEKKCVKCGECVAVCPVNPKALNWSITGKDKPPVYDYSKCIRCYCCQEFCPKKAISLKKPLIRKFLLR